MIGQDLKNIKGNLYVLNVRLLIFQVESLQDLECGTIGFRKSHTKRVITVNILGDTLTDYEV